MERETGSGSGRKKGSGNQKRGIGFSGCLRKEVKRGGGKRGNGHRRKKPSGMSW